MSNPSGTMECPVCGENVPAYFTVDDRAAQCGTCALETARLARRLTGGQIAGGVGLGLLAAVATSGAWIGIAASSLSSSGQLPFHGYGRVLSSIAIGLATGSATHWGSRGRGGRLFQVTAVISASVAIIFALGSVIALATTVRPDSGANMGPWILAALVAAPTRVLVGLDPWIAIGVVYGMVNAWRPNRARPVVLRGPFPVGGAPAPAKPTPAATGPAVRAVIPPPAPHARAAGFDFERPQ